MIDDVLEQLRRREPLCHRQEFGRTRADFERILSPNFLETGASGRRYERAFVLDQLDLRYASAFDDVWQASDFARTALAPNVFLLTYTLLQDGVRWTRRATIWDRSDGDWRAVYHQGTLMDESSS